MKKIVLLICILSSSSAWSQNADTIPNAGFEDWYWVNWFYNPINWNTNNTQLLINTVVTDSDSYSGDLAMMLTNQGALVPHAYCSFTVSHHPLALNGYIKNQLVNNDSAVFEVRLYENNILTDSGYQVIYGGINPNYGSFMVPISQDSPNPDSCIISFYGGSVYQSSISIDDLAFTFPSSIFENDESAQFSIGPNPTNGLLYTDVHCNSCSDENIIATLYDIAGKKMFDQQLLSSNQMNLEKFPDGAYILTLSAGRCAERRLIIKSNSE